jgi:hypothetical protein
MSSQQPAITSYGERSARAPMELDLFSFLVGKWHGTGTAKGPDGSPVEFEMSWIGRYVLDGTAIADEFHGATPDGKPYLGISLRHYDAVQRAWIVEYLNVTGSFLRRQVNPRSGGVSRQGDAIIVTSKDGEMRIREFYRVNERDRFTYTTDLSRDAGKTWDPPGFEITLTRVE